jgi:hypothetical protein
VCMDAVLKESVRQVFQAQLAMFGCFQIEYGNIISR